MTHFFDVSALGLRVRVSFAADTDAAFVQRASDAWVDAILSDAGEPDIDVAVPLPGDEDAILERLSVDVTLAALSARRGSMFMFHAAGLAAPDGRVVAFIGPSGRGKTTLTRTLAQVYGYVSDETVAIDEDGGVHPYRKPLSIVRAGRPKEQVAGSVFGLRPLPEHPLRLAALVVLDRVDAPGTPSVARVALADALPEMITQMSYLPELERPLQRVAELAEAQGGLLRLTYAEADALLPVVDDILNDRIPHSTAPRFQHCMPSESRSDALFDSELRDAIDDGETVVILRARTATVLAGIGPEVWRALVAGATRDEVVEAVVDRYGMPPGGGPEQIVDAVIEELIIVGALAPQHEARTQ